MAPLKRPRRKSDILNMSLNVSQVVGLVFFIWQAAVKYQEMVDKQHAVLVMVGDTKSDIGELAARVGQLEQK